MTGFPAELAELRRLIEAQERAGSTPSPEATQDLQTAYEELRVADEEVRSQQEQIARLLEGQHLLLWEQERMLALLPVPVLVADERGMVRTVNAAAAALVGMRVARMLGKPVLSFFAPGERAGLRRQLAEQSRDKETFRDAATVVGRDQPPVTVEVTVSSVGERTPQTSTWMLLPVRQEETADPTRDPVREGLPAALVRLAALQTTDLDTQQLLVRAVAICQEALGPDAEVSLSIGPPLEPEAVATSGSLAQAVDGAQVHAGEGPCATAFEVTETVETAEVRDDPRWPRLAPHLPGAVHGVVSVPLEVGAELVGALNTYRTVPGVERWFVVAAELLAATVAAVLYEREARAEVGRLAADMERALTSRAVIDQAKGIVMAERRCGAEAAFAHLVGLSSTQQRKLRDVAQDIVDSVET